MFDWMTVRPNASFVATFPAKREAMVRRELEERAALLCRLRYRRDVAKARLRANLMWEYEKNPPAPLVAEINSIVARVWKRSEQGL